MRASAPSGLAFVESVNVLLASGRPPPGAIEPRLIRADPQVKPEGRLSPFQGEGFYRHSPLPIASFRRTPESRGGRHGMCASWIPACAGMTSKRLALRLTTAGGGHWMSACAGMTKWG